MKRKDRYTIDSKNRLIIKKHNQKNLITNGRFTVDKDNQLIYWLNEPLNWRRQYNLPSKISFTGNWQLTPNYDLELNLDETKSQYKGNRLILKGELISTDRDSLGFQIVSQDKYGLSHLQLLRLFGFWQADEYNRLSFVVKKKIASPDILTLESSWQVNKNQQLVYTYEKTDLKTKTKTLHVLTFEGFWQINNSSRLTYILLSSLDSRFDFRVQIETPNLYPQEGVIKYRIGIGIRKQRLSQTKTIYLYGAWKFSRKAGLTFQMDYGYNEFRNIEFGTNIYLSKKDEIVFSLVNKRKELLGLNITFTHRFLKKLDAETFLRLKDVLDKKETAIEAGVRIPF